MAGACHHLVCVPCTLTTPHNARQHACLERLFWGAGDVLPGAYGQRGASGGIVWASWACEPVRTPARTHHHPTSPQHDVHVTVRNSLGNFPQLDNKCLYTRQRTPHMVPTTGAAGAVHKGERKMAKFQARHMEAIAGAVSIATARMFDGVTTGADPDYSDGMREARAEIVRALVSMLAEDNERFDVDRFRTACLA